MKPGPGMEPGPGRPALRPPHDPAPLPAREPRLLQSLSLPYLAELAGDQVATVLRTRPQHALHLTHGPGTGQGASEGAGPVPPLRPELRWRHPLSPRRDRMALSALLTILALLLLGAVLVLFHLAAPAPQEAPQTVMAMVWEGPAVIGPERDAPPEPVDSAALPDSDAVPLEAPPPPAPETAPEPGPDAPPEAEAEAAPEPAESQEAPPDMAAAPQPAAQPPAPAEADDTPPQQQAAAEAAPAEGPAAAPDWDGTVPLPRKRPAPLVADVVMPQPQRQLPDREPEPERQAAGSLLPNRPVDMTGAGPDAPQRDAARSPQAPTQQIALQVFASDGPAPRRIEGFPLPAYPVRARLLSLEGKVTLNVKIGPKGGQGHVWVAQSSGHPELDTAAYDAILQWRFSPPTYDGQRVSTVVEIPVSFKLRRPEG